MVWGGEFFSSDIMWWLGDPRAYVFFLRKEGLIYDAPESYIPKNVFFLREEVLIYIYFSYILRPPLEGRALHSQDCFFPPRGGFNLRLR
jgi:hypothetical protein